jgi:REP element-mobilizing transposase RayT
MPRRPRLDRPGLLHHVLNRGISRRTVFETRRDVRIFLAHLARLVREERVEIHVFCFLATHFHLVVRSLDGDISETMRRLQNFFVRDFNRLRRRDGPLFRGRFMSIPVESVRYLQTLIRYIDQNALEAHVVTRSEDHLFGSARYHCGEARPPPWLSRDLVDEFLSPLIADGATRADAYRCVFAPRLSPSLQRFIARRIAWRARGEDPIDRLVGAPGSELLDWMTRKARLADGTRPGLAVVDPSSIWEVLRSRRSLPSPCFCIGLRRRRSGVALASAAVLHDLAGETFTAIAKRRGGSDVEARRLYQEHCRLLSQSTEYGDFVTEFAAACLRSAFDGSPALPHDLTRLRGVVGRR